MWWSTVWLSKLHLVWYVMTWRHLVIFSNPRGVKSPTEHKCVLLWCWPYFQTHNPSVSKIVIYFWGQLGEAPPVFYLSSSKTVSAGELESELTETGRQWHLQPQNNWLTLVGPEKCSFGAWGEPETVSSGLSWSGMLDQLVYSFQGQIHEISR